MKKLIFTFIALFIVMWAQLLWAGEENPGSMGTMGVQLLLVLGWFLTFLAIVIYLVAAIRTSQKDKKVIYYVSVVLIPVLALFLPKILS